LCIHVIACLRNKSYLKLSSITLVGRETLNSVLVHSYILLNIMSLKMKSKRSVFFIYIKNEHVDFKECTNGKYSYGSGGTQGT